jgi:predicted nucleic acid-binding protein
LRILVDTSVWIDFFRGAPTAENALLKDCLNRREHIFVTGVVVQEILQGIRDDSQYLAVKEYVFLFPKVDVEFSDHVEAASVYRNLRKKGLTIDSPVDCLIAVLALRHDLALLHRDSDFTLISHRYPLRILS